MAIATQINRDATSPEHSGHEAFTLIEIAIVVAIIGVLSVLIIPGAVSSRKRAQGKRIVQDARQLNTAISEWAIENNKQDGDTIDTLGAATYLKSSWPKKDILGNNYKLSTVGTNQISIAKKTKKALAGIGIDWGPY